MNDTTEVRQPPQNGPYFQSPMQQLGGAITSLTNPYAELHELELSFRGKTTNEDGEEVDVGQAIMNDKGVMAIMGMTRSIVNKITIMGNLNKQEIANLMEFASDTLAKTLMVKKLEYEIKAEDRDMIYFKVLSYIFLCLKRPFEEGDRRFWRGSQQEITTRVEGSNKNRSIVDKVMGWGK